MLFYLVLFRHHLLAGDSTFIHHELIRVVCAHLAATSYRCLFFLVILAAAPVVFETLPSRRAVFYPPILRIARRYSCPRLAMPEELDALSGDLKLLAGWLMMRGVNHH